MNARLQILLGTLAVAIALPWAGPLSTPAVERQIAQHMNEGAGYEVTRKVACVRKNRAGATVRYTCALHGNTAAPLRVRVDVDGNDWRAYWPPVDG